MQQHLLCQLESPRIWCAPLCQCLHAGIAVKEMCQYAASKPSKKWRTEKNLSKKVRNHHVMYTVTAMGNSTALHAETW